MLQCTHGCDLVASPVLAFQVNRPVLGREGVAVFGMPPQGGTAGGPNEPPPEPIAICGSSILLPGNLTSGAELFDLIRSKTQMRGDCVALGRAPASIMEPQGGPYSGNPWKLKSHYYNIFSEEERTCPLSSPLPPSGHSHHTAHTRHGRGASIAWKGHKVAGGTAPPAQATRVARGLEGVV